jgi:hypothetical protein
LYRVKGYDPKNGDWYWMKYLENGTLVRTPASEGNQPVAGRVASCINCHSKAAGGDFVFSNDPSDKMEMEMKPGEKMPDEKSGKEPTKADEKADGKKDQANHSIASGAEILVGSNWPASERVSIEAISHRPWDVLLKHHVDTKGQVDYASWKGSPDDVRELGRYLNTLSRADNDRPATRAARLAYWINAYNALTVWGILREYPTPSVQTHAEPHREYNLWRDLRLRVGDTSLSLGQIENEVLRKMGEPRIHFAIVCGAQGCPRLLNEGYDAANLETQLTEHARVFFADPTKFDYDPFRDQIRLSPIIDWYAGDFGTSQAERLRAIQPYLPDDAARRLTTKGAANVIYQDYDWRLNDRATHEPETTTGGGGADGER